VRNGFIHLLDYKPQARDIDPVNQLIVYALAFASRTKLPVKVFKCAWFDEKDYFEFFPLKAVRPKTTRTRNLPACAVANGSERDFMLSAVSAREARSRDYEAFA
jgi:hypothetical protein